jgi:MFS family permease
MKTQRFLALLLILILALMGCSSKKYADRYREGDNSGQEVELTVDQEKQLTKEALAQMKKEYPAADNKELQDYIERLGQKIVNANNLNNKPYTYNFTVVDSSQINAFALPAGAIFMTAPIIAAADSEAEIAGVLGHEIGHVVARHTAERMYVAKKEQGKTWLIGGVGAALGGAAGFLLGKKLCREGDSACRAKYAMYGLGGGAVGGLAGAIYASQIRSIQPELFTLNLSIMILACVVFGGMGNIWGVILGAVILGYIPEKLRFLSDYRIVFFGLLMVVMMNIRPNGLLPRQKREKFQEKSK